MSDNLVLFERPKHLGLQKPRFQVSVEANSDGSQVVMIEADVPALRGWLETDVEGVQFADNFFHLRPGQACRIGVGSGATIRDGDVMRSLVDTF